LVGVGLKSLANFPTLPNLIKLDLSDNKISGGFEHLSHLTELISLVLANNKVASFEALQPLQALENMRTLDLFRCPVAELEPYRSRVFEMFERLKILDGIN
jgi:acidic leucine-rich nuclear phosphoprotein 32 family protein A/C/D